MISIFDYLDYRSFLKDYYTEKKQANPWFSYRYIENRVSMNASHLVKIFQGTRHISSKSICRFIELCQLSGKGAEYFETLVRFTKAKSDAETKQTYEKLLALKDIRKFTVEKNQYEFYQKWYYSAILTLLHFYPFAGDYAALAKKLSPAITPGEAKKAVSLLKNLGLLRESPGGGVELTNAFITTGEVSKSILVRDYQKATMCLAAESLYRHPRDVRDISTVTITVDSSEMDAIHEMIAQFRSMLLKFTEKTDKPDSVYQLNIQFFPLTEPESGDAGERV